MILVVVWCGVEFGIISAPLWYKTKFICNSEMLGLVI